MKEEKFHPIKIYCPDCKKGVVILDVMFSIKGSINFKLCCAICGKEMSLLTSWDRVICYCAEQEVVTATVFEGTKTLQ
jgi:hypothetical protein